MSTPSDIDNDWGLLSSYLDQALELEEPDLAVWLARIAANDPALAGRIQELLAVRHRQDFPPFLAQSPAPPITSAFDATLTGRAVGPYVIDTELGRGGMGSVWRAHRVDGHYDATVAIKFVHASWIGRSGEQRFRTEGQLLGRLDHPHIARLLDAGVLEGAQPYLVLEYVAGQAIHSYCEQHALGIEQRIRLFLDVLRAVAHAHRNLVVHRDLKPSNILVTTHGTVKLLDFGIAKLLDVEPSEATQSGASALTPRYAAPEQLLGQPVTTATDVYALGVVLYELLTTSHPFALETNSHAELLRAIASTTPRPASTVAGLGAVARRSVKGDLDNILLKTLKKDPAERYASVSAFSDDLERFLTHQPVQARPDTLAYRMSKFVRRHRGGVAAGIVTTVAIVSGLIGTVIQAERASAQAGLARQQTLKAQQERDRALRELTYVEAGNEFVNFLLGEGTAKPFTTQELLERADRLVTRQFASDAAPRAGLQLMIGGAYGQSGNSNRALEILKRARDSASLAGDVSLGAIIECTMGDVHGDDGDFEAAKGLINGAIARLRAQPEPDAAALTSCLAKRGDVEASLGEGAAALASGKEALQLLGTPRPGQRALAVDGHTTLAEAYGRLGNLSLAILEHTAALDELRSMGREHTGQAGVVLNNLAEKLSRAGRFGQAMNSYGESLAIQQQVNGAGIGSPKTEANYAVSLFNNGRLSESRVHFEHALSIARRRDQKTWVAYILLMGVPTLCASQQLSRCASQFNEARTALQSLGPPGSHIHGVIELTAARLAVAQGVPALARTHLQQSLSILNANSELSQSQVIAYSLLAEIDQQLGDTAAAERAATSALEKAQAMRSGFEHTAWMGMALLAKAEVLSARGNNAEALPLLLQARADLEDSAGPDSMELHKVRTLIARLSTCGGGCSSTSSQAPHSVG